MTDVVVNYLPTGPFDGIAGAFVSGVPGTSNPTVVTKSRDMFSEGQIISVDDATLVPLLDEDGKIQFFSDSEEIIEVGLNDGIYEVLSHRDHLLTIRGIGSVPVVEDFAKSQFVADATGQGTIYLLRVSVLRASPDGNWVHGIGETTPLTYKGLDD